MIGFLTKDNEGYKLHDSFGAFFNENTETWESCNSKKNIKIKSLNVMIGLSLNLFKLLCYV